MYQMHPFALLNTVLGAGISSAGVYYLAMNVDPLIAAIVWTLPFTMIFPVYNMHAQKKSNSFISSFLRTQTYSMVLLVAFLYATAYFIDAAPKGSGVVVPMLQGFGGWFMQKTKEFYEQKSILWLAECNCVEYLEAVDAALRKEEENAA